MRPTPLQLTFVLLTTVAGMACAAPDQQAAETEDDVATPGPWRLPEDLVTRAEAQSVSYDYGPPWEGGIHCATGPTPGSRALAAYLLRTFPGEIRSIGGFACRPNTASPEETSLHGTGRALDIMIPTVRGDADNAKGDRVVRWLVEHAQEVGVQYIIWDHSSWFPGDGEASPYGGPVPHVDHIHAELDEEAAAKGTPWFQGR
jgi:hypothetical protein